jgi:Type IV Pilus-assembly protein W
MSTRQTQQVRRLVSAPLQAGRTLIELLIALVLSLMIVAAVGALYDVTSRSSRNSQQLGSAEERGKLAMFFLGEPIALAAYGNINSADFNRTRFQANSFQGPHLRACTNGRFQNVAAGDFTCVASASPGDHLFVSYQAESVTSAPQGQVAMTDCLGQNAPMVGGVPIVANAYSVEPAVSGVLEFGCLGNGGVAPNVLVRDVEDFKVYFAFDPNSHAQADFGGSPHTIRPTALLTATQVSALPGSLDAPEAVGNPWNHIVAVYVCVLLRTAEAGTTPDGISRFRPCPQTEVEAATGTAEVQVNDGVARRSYTQVFTVRTRAQARAGSQAQ